MRQPVRRAIRIAGWALALIFTAALLLFCLSLKSYPLINGYRLQGPAFTQGWVFKGWLIPAGMPEIMGIQGCNHWLIGSVKDDASGSNNSYFILNTETDSLAFYNANDWYAELRSARCKGNMNDETNMTGLQMGERFNPGF